MSFAQFVLQVLNMFSNLNCPNEESHITLLPDLLFVGFDVVYLHFYQVFLCGFSSSAHDPVVSIARPIVQFYATL